MPTIIETLGQFAAGLSLEAVPERVVRKARWQVLSTLGAIHASARHELGQLAVSTVEALAGDGPCSLIPSGRKVDVLSAVYAASALSLALDYDDYLLFGHSSHSAVCAPLLVGESLDVPLSEVLAAQIAANEIAGRLGAAVVLGPHNGQAWSHIHLAAAAAGTARLMRLPADRVAHAIAIALYQPNFVLWPGFMGPDSKLTTAATPTVAGVRAAFLAARGATGALDILECRGGFLERFSYAPLPAFFSGFGVTWTTDTLAFKPWPGCAYVDSTVDAIAALRDQLARGEPDGATRFEVDRIDVAATLLTVQMDALARAGGHFDALSPVALNFSIPGNAALTWLAGRLDVDDLRRETLAQNADRILLVADRVHLSHDPGLTADMLLAFDRVLDLRALLSEIPLRKLGGALAQLHKQQPPSGKPDADRATARAWFGALRRLWARTPRDGSSGARPFDLAACDLSRLEMPFAARVSVRLRDGTTLTRAQRVPRGAPGRPAQETHELVVDKCVRESARALGTAGATRLAELVFDESATASSLVRAACAG